MSGTRWQDDYREQVERMLERLLPSERDELFAGVIDAMRYSLLGGGKRIRPLLLLEFCRLCGGDPEKALPWACALEMIHSYSLIHDDLPCMDDDDMRRGRASCHKVYGEATALLAGDALLTMAFETSCSPEYAAAVGEDRALRASWELARAAGAYGMVGGQQIDLSSEGRGISLDVLRKMDECKTGALIRAAARMGCILGGGREELLQAADRYARALGLAFQIVDDVLDVTGTPETLGKPVRSDLERDKATYVSLLGLAEAGQEAKRLTDEAVEALAPFGLPADTLRGLAIQLSSREK